MRLIAIVLGEDNSSVRNSETMALLDYGFNTYEMQVVKKKDEVVKTEKLEKATKEKIEFVPLTDIGVLVKKGEGQKEYTYDIKMDNLKLPVKKGEAVGKVIVKDQNTIIAEGDLTVTEDIKPLSFLSLFKKTLQDIVAGKASI